MVIPCSWMTDSLRQSLGQMASQSNTFGGMLRGSTCAKPPQRHTQRREVQRLREIVDNARQIIEDHDAKHGKKDEA